MDATPDKRQQARELADEYLGPWGARIARTAVGPLGALSRLVLVAGLVLWTVGPAPFWKSAPSMAFSVLSLVVLVAPGVRLLRYRRRMQAVLNDLPDLLATLEGAETSPTQDPGALVRLRGDAPVVKAMDDLNDALSTSTGPAVFLTAVALVAGLVEVVFAPVAVLVRLAN